jgi:DNA-binding MurR/RpiR family transcriptional regulator
VTRHWDDLARAERTVARHLAAIAPEVLLLETADSLAGATKTSDATVVRTVRKLGYLGLGELKREASSILASEKLSHIHARVEMSSSDFDFSRTIEAVTLDASARIADTAAAADTDSYEESTRIILESSEVVCYGWGFSALGARYLAMRLNRMGKRATSIDATGFELAEALLPVAAGTAVVVFARARHLPDLDLIFDHAEAVGAKTILVTSALDHLKSRAKSTIVVTQSEYGVTAEPLTEMFAADVIALALTGAMPQVSLRSYELLNRLRHEISPSDIDMGG